MNRRLKKLLNMVFAGAVLAVTALVVFATTQAVLTQPPENAAAYLRLF